MKRVLFLLILIAALYARVGVTAPVSVPQVVDQFSLTNYQELLMNVLYTSQGMNRGSGWGDQYLPCRDAIYNRFQNLGLQPSLDAFSYLGGQEGMVTGWNVVAIKSGLQNPSNEIYVVSGHYDSAGSPGADDDASGVACVLEMARIFKQHTFAKTIVFIAFDAEERIDLSNHQPGPGSVHYVNQHLADNIKGMVSVDMIAHQTSGSLSNTAQIEGLSQTASIRNDLKSAVDGYGRGLQAFLASQPGDSDHVPFMDIGFQACCLTEADWTGNPYFHTPADYATMSGNIDWIYAEKMCRSAIGYFATHLGLIDVTPTALIAERGTNGTAIIHFKGIAGCKYATEVNSVLNKTGWSVIETNTASAQGNVTAIDPTAGNNKTRFYRARFVPQD